MGGIIRGLGITLDEIQDLQEAKHPKKHSPVCKASTPQGSHGRAFPAESFRSSKDEGIPLLDPLGNVTGEMRHD